MGKEYFDTISIPLPHPRPVPDPHDLHYTRPHPIPDQIRRHGRQLSQLPARPPTFRIVSQALRRQLQPLRHALRRQRPELMDMRLDRRQIGQRPE